MSWLSSGLDIGTKGYGGFVSRTTIMAIVGGTASVIGGGKFSNGAVSGAFVHMFNAEVKAFIRGGITKEMKERAKYYTKGAKMARGQAIHENMQEYSMPLMAAWVNGIAVLTGGFVLEAGYSFAMVNPVSTITGIGVVDNLFLGGTAPTNIFEGMSSQLHDYNPCAVK